MPLDCKAAEFRNVDLASALGLVTLAQMVAALTEAVEHPPEGVRILSVPDIRRASRTIQQRSGR